MKKQPRAKIRTRQRRRWLKSAAPAIVKAYEASQPDLPRIQRALAGPPSILASPARQAFTPQQEAAALAFTIALDAYVREFGVVGAGSRMAEVVALLRHNAQYEAVSARILEARRPINNRILELQAAGRWADADALVDTPTPNYPGKARDDAWLAKLTTQSKAA